ncbi:MAG: potassium channel family protein, partial [Fidelibacterota bacterium]
DAGRLWTILVILFGVSGFAAIVAKVGTSLLEFNRYRRRLMFNRIKNMHDHYILCGFGRMGAIIAQELHEKNLPFIVVESNEEKIDTIQDLKYKYIQGDATREEILMSAYAHKARGIVVTLETDQDNLFVTMTARIINPDAYILSRCRNFETQSKMKRAGANKVINPYVAGGHKMAELLTQPAIQDTFSISLQDREVDLVIDEFNVDDLPDLVGLMIKDSHLREESSLMIVGVKETGQETIINPDPHHVIMHDQTILVLGTKEKMEAFREKYVE